MSTKN
jgi:serine/threonine protein kinase